MQGPNACVAKKCCVFLLSLTLQNRSEYFQMQNLVSVEEQMEAFNHKTQWKQLKHILVFISDITTIDLLASYCVFPWQPHC